MESALKVIGWIMVVLAAIGSFIVMAKVGFVYGFIVLVFGCSNGLVVVGIGELISRVGMILDNTCEMASRNSNNFEEQNKIIKQQNSILERIANKE